MEHHSDESTILANSWPHCKSNLRSGWTMGWMDVSGSVVSLFDYSCTHARIAGVLPFIIDGTQVKVSKTLGAYDITMLLIISFVDVFMWFFNTEEQAENASVVNKLIYFAQQVASLLTIGISLLWIISSQRTLQEALNELIKFEIIVRPKNATVTFRFLGSLYIMFLTIGLLDFFLLSPPVSIAMRLTLNIRYHLSASIVFSVVANFTSLIKIVEKSYEALASSVINIKSNASQNLKNVQKAAEHLVAASEALNASFGPQLLLITSSSFVLITGNIYLLINADVLAAKLVSAVWISVYVTMMLHLISSCTLVSEAAERFEKILNRTILEDKTGRLSQEVRSCLHFTNSRRIEFNAFGFFPINFSLAGSMVAAAATYLVVLNQIGSAEKGQAARIGTLIS